MTADKFQCLFKLSKTIFFNFPSLFSFHYKTLLFVTHIKEQQKTVVTVREKLLVFCGRLHTYFVHTHKHTHTQLVSLDTNNNVPT